MASSSSPSPRAARQAFARWARVGAASRSTCSGCTAIDFRVSLDRLSTSHTKLTGRSQNASTTAS